MRHVDSHRGPERLGHSCRDKCCLISADFCIAICPRWDMRLKGTVDISQTQLNVLEKLLQIGVRLLRQFTQWRKRSGGKNEIKGLTNYTNNVNASVWSGYYPLRVW